MKAEDYAESAALVIEECTKALKAIEPEKVLEYLEMLTVARKVFFVGVGECFCHSRQWQKDMHILALIQ